MSPWQPELVTIIICTAATKNLHLVPVVCQSVFSICLINKELNQKMYTEFDAISFNLSTSASLNNLASITSKAVTHFALHDNEKIAVTASNGSINKEICFETTPEDNQNCLNLIKFVRLLDSPFLVAASGKFMKIYSPEADYKLIFTFNLNLDGRSTVHSIETLGKTMLAVGTMHRLFFFTYTGNNKFQSKNSSQNLLTNPRSYISNLISHDDSWVVLLENTGLMTTWKFEEKNCTLIKTSTIEIHPNTKSTCIKIYKNLVLIGTISGQIQIINLTNGQLMVEIQAHSKCITSLDIALKSGLFISASEDSHLRLFQLKYEKDCNCIVDHLYESILYNEIICGVNFLNSAGQQFAISTYESSHVKLFKKSQ